MINESGITILTFWTVFFSVLAFERLFVVQEDPVVTRLKQLVMPIRNDEKKISEESGQDASGLKEMKERLLLAGLKRKSDLRRFIIFQRICFAIPLVIAIFSVFFFRTSSEHVAFSALISAMIFVPVPRLWLLHSIFRRRKEMTKFFSDTLDLLTVALEAGLSFDSALVRVGEEQRRVSTQISRELLFTNHQILVGKSRDEALQGLAKRCGVDEISAFVRAVIQSNKLGTSLVKTLNTQADELRKKRKQNIQAQILKAPVKLIFPLLFFIFPTLLVVILGPSLVQIFRYLRVTGVPS